ncbi:MAG: hypothetical protein IPL10_20115 [Bacteroidetes bacterium]|jgi:hypothetical protein|nr:hypothetical protein [Bacteroidota bacterium]
MKKNTIIHYILIILIAAVVSSCKKALKNMDDYYPKVSIVSAEIQTDGSVLVTGKIDSEGDAPIERLGFCCNTKPNPTLTNRQIISEINGSTFTAIYTGLDEDSVYYFRTWATNSYGYKYGTETSIENIVAAPVIPACTLPISYLDNGTGNGSTSYYYVSVPTNSWQLWEFSASPQFGNALNFKFGSAIKTGVYTTENSSSPQSGRVLVSFQFGWLGPVSLESGSKVYVNAIGKDTFDITICNAPWKYNTTNTFTLNTRFTCPD